MEPMQIEAAKFVGELYKIGYKYLLFEGTSPFGVHAYGISDPLLDFKKGVLQAVPGQNDLSWYDNHQSMGCGQSLVAHWNRNRPAGDLPQWVFKFLANGSVTLLDNLDRQWNSGPRRYP